MSTAENVRDTLELYLRGELDTAQSAETAGLIQSDPAWREIHTQLLLERVHRFNSCIDVVVIFIQ